jgi:hypothetical protein
VRVLFIVSVVVALAVAGYGAYLLLIGIPETMVIAVPPGEPLPEGTTTYRATPAGVVPLLAGLAIVIGLRSRRIAVAWIGGLAAAAFSVAFVFGVGGILIGPAAALLLALAALTWLGVPRIA